MVCYNIFSHNFPLYFSLLFKILYHFLFIFESKKDCLIYYKLVKCL
ncbi:hypothetical protein ANHYDRO_01900 [Anaerococcus hydrogenalis DSM 7454]|uniref:Uncharacterized protein n=1 Tax=Anaerococcus hydrogenalis DSM 7454 TaxID=561177 RepID=B6WBB7_9FIRM|nr:hypothetical protein ANHYDRO_01900 [Anaerococcus hydrogenalis DSM 7454]